MLTCGSSKRVGFTIWVGSEFAEFRYKGTGKGGQSFPDADP